jgi:hypothetical protein
MGRACSMEEMRSSYKILVEKPEGNIILKCMIGKYDGDVDWIHLA